MSIGGDSGRPVHARLRTSILFGDAGVLPVLQEDILGVTITGLLMLAQVALRLVLPSQAPRGATTS